MIFKLASLLIISNTKNFSLLRLPKKEAKSEKQKNRKERIFRKNVLWQPKFFLHLSLNTCNLFQTILAIFALKGDFCRVVFSRGPGGQVGNVGQMLTKVASQ